MAAVVSHAQPADPLPSWNAGRAKARIVAFVQAVTEPGGKDVVAPADRIAEFDDGGTLWSEQPDWLATACHPGFQRPYTEPTFAPMAEPPARLRANGFQTWIVPGGGMEFIRVFAEQACGVPPQSTSGSSPELKCGLRHGQPVPVQQPEVAFIDDRAGKPVGIPKAIGTRPVAASGSSDGDFQMLEWTTSAPGARLGVLVRHDGAVREVACDGKSPIGTLDRSLDEAGSRGWTVVGLQDDWKQVHVPAR